MKKPPKFKQVACYTIEIPGVVGQDALDSVVLGQWQATLARYVFQPCGKTEWVKWGVLPFFPDSSFYLYPLPPYYFFRVEEERRLLPAAVIKQALDEKVRLIESEEHRPVSRREKQDLKEAIALELLPRAFTRRRSHHIYLDLHRQMLVLDRTSPQVLDQLLQFWREIFPLHTLRLMDFETTPAKLMGDWLRSGSGSTDFALDERCQIRHPKTQGQIKGDGQDLTDPEWANWLLEGYQVNSLGLIFKDHLRFTLQENFQLKNIQWPEEDQDETQTDPAQEVDDTLEWEASLRLQATAIQQVIMSLGSELSASEFSGPKVEPLSQKTTPQLSPILAESADGTGVPHEHSRIVH